MQAASDILLTAGEIYSKEFLQGAQAELEAMKNYFLVPHWELTPQVYVQVTSNWVQLTMRYVVDPKKRRQASSFIFTEVFKQAREHPDITIASQTMEIAMRGSLMEVPPQTKPRGQGNLGRSPARRQLYPPDQTVARVINERSNSKFFVRQSYFC